jgi:hypothetical protein
MDSDVNDSVIQRQDNFVLHRLRAKPVTYTVEINHFVSDGKWTCRLKLIGIGDLTEQQRKNISADLEWAAEQTKSGEFELSS